MFLLSDLAPKPSKAANHPDVADLGATAHQAIIEIFRNRNPSAIDRFFSEPFVQHDPNITDGLSGLKAFAAEVASSPTANVTIYRTLVDGDIVMLHSKYEGLRGFAGPIIAFDLFRFKGGKMVEHWGGQDAEVGPNPSGHTQVDGPIAVVDRDRTEANRSLVRAFKQVVTVELRFDRVDEFIDGEVTEISPQRRPIPGGGAVAVRRLRPEQCLQWRIPVRSRHRYPNVGQRCALGRRNLQLCQRCRVGRTCAGKQ
jgi:predicted SnoaL-like aldol condensation-catalyzing enzyme